MNPLPPVYVFPIFFLFSDLVLRLSSAASGDCPSTIYCGNLGKLHFPFTTSHRKNCGMLAIHGCNDSNPNAPKTVLLKNEKLRVRYIDECAIFVTDDDLKSSLANGSCEAFGHNISVPPRSALGYFQIRNNITLYKCNSKHQGSPPKQFLNYTGCFKSKNEMIYFGTQNQENPPALAACSRVQLPVTNLAFSGDPFTFVAAEFPIEFHFSDDCKRCYFGKQGQCRLDDKGGTFCSKSRGVLAWKLGLGIGVGASILVIGLVLSLRNYERKKALSHVQLRSTNTCNDPDTDPDSGRLFFGVPIFSYKELQEATDNFHPSTKLGDGGFGTVYHGKLQDGREVAVKHLFNHYHKRVEQFMNEIEILTRLRHRNLVSLYGCTSHQSRELLLVYEYIPNGTVASHLRGHTANPALLTWPKRIKIAIETASALAYLHASGIIHRDVKTNNILLDDNFCVKVADFGLSRLFPNDVSHVSTAPQGTPGYLDPEYHCCFRLTNKSDVYSFGVVLMELISSMPAVDIGRDTDEITLGNLAVRKIQRSEFEELVDPCLGIEKDSEVKKMLVAVGELAFQCLQRDRELRPSIDKVLEVLKKIEGGKEEGEDGGISESKADIHLQAVASLKRDQTRLLNIMKSPSSPSSVTEKWGSDSTTPKVSV